MRQAEQVLASIAPVTSTQRQRLELAHDTLDEIRMLDAKLKRSKTRITDAVTASGTTLIEILGIGPIISALFIGYTGDIARSRPPATSPRTTGSHPSSSPRAGGPCTGCHGAGTGR